MKSTAAEPLPPSADAQTTSVRPIHSGVTHVEQRGGRSPLAGSLVLIDPKPFTRRLIRDMLAETFPNYIIHEVPSFEDLKPDTRRTETRLIIIYIRDAALLDPLVQHSLDFFSERKCNVPIVFLSDHIEADDLGYALARGVRGYIPTSTGCDVARAALKLVEAGGTYIPADAVRDATLRPQEQRKTGDGLDLTPRELSVFQLMREGSPNKVIATQLRMQESTVKVHVRNILKKFQATNRTHAVSIANKLSGEIGTIK